MAVFFFPSVDLFLGMGELQSTLGSVDLHYKLGLPGLWYSDGQVKLLSILGAAEQTVGSGSPNSTLLQHLLTRPTWAFLLRASNHCFYRDPKSRLYLEIGLEPNQGLFILSLLCPRPANSPVWTIACPCPARAPLAER